MCSVKLIIGIYNFEMMEKNKKNGAGTIYKKQEREWWYRNFGNHYPTAIIRLNKKKLIFEVNLFLKIVHKTNLWNSCTQSLKTAKLLSCWEYSFQRN